MPNTQKSPIINDTAFPEYNFTVEQTYTLDETLVDLFANAKVSVSLFESLPKDKTSVLGVGEMSLFSKFYKPKNKDVLSFKEDIPIVYSNQKLLQPMSAEGGPEFEIEVSLSRPLLSEQELAGGTFISFRIEDVFPVPEDWTLKEGNEKDPNSSVFYVFFECF